MPHLNYITIKILYWPDSIYKWYNTKKVQRGIPLSFNQPNFLQRQLEQTISYWYFQGYYVHIVYVYVLVFKSLIDSLLFMLFFTLLFFFFFWLNIYLEFSDMAKILKLDYAWLISCLHHIVNFLLPSSENKICCWKFCSKKQIK